MESDKEGWCSEDSYTLEHVEGEPDSPEEMEDRHGPDPCTGELKCLFIISGLSPC